MNTSGKLQAARKRPPGKSGYYGVSGNKGQFQATLHIKVVAHKKGVRPQCVRDTKPFSSAVWVHAVLTGLSPLPAENQKFNTLSR